MQLYYKRFTRLDDVYQGAFSLMPRTLIIDVEPVVAQWNTDTADLARGMTTTLARLSTLHSLLVVHFSTNSHRQSLSLPPNYLFSLKYTAAACKPLRTRLYDDLPRPGAVIGDQIATDGVLAWRLGFAFLHFTPPPDELPLGPKVMSMMGRPLLPLLFRPSAAKSKTDKSV